MESRDAIIANQKEEINDLKSLIAELITISDSETESNNNLNQIIEEQKDIIKEAVTLSNKKTNPLYS